MEVGQKAVFITCRECPGATYTGSSLMRLIILDSRKGFLPWCCKQNPGKPVGINRPKNAKAKMTRAKQRG